jgi:hypothetical protein
LVEGKKDQKEKGKRDKMTPLIVAHYVGLAAGHRTPFGHPKSVSILHICGSKISLHPIDLVRKDLMLGVNKNTTVGLVVSEC